MESIASSFWSSFSDITKSVARDLESAKERVLQKIEDIETVRKARAEAA